MMASSQAQFIPAIDKLTGRDNYITWQFAVQAYMEHEDLWNCVTGKENDERKLVKAKSKLILLVHPSNFVHINKCETAQEIWNALQNAFCDSGLTRRVGLIRTLTSTKLNDCANVEEYVQVIMNAAQKLRCINCDVSDEWIGTFMLAGLPHFYQPMIMALENSGIKITADTIKTKLLQDIKSGENSDSSKAFYTFKGKKNHKKKDVKSLSSESSSGENHVQCYTCHLYGHKSFNCPLMKKKNISLQNVNKTKKGAFVVSSGVLNNNEWFLDSASSFHMSPREDWLTSQINKPIDHIVTANDAKLEVKSAGVVQVNVSCNDVNNEISINNVLHVPNLSSNLLSVSQLCQKGHTVIFTNGGCQILDSHMDLVATGRHFSAT
ncbi:Retrovirus-related Pol polyprotein from transposon TNT 1-94 [Pseudolycoriella hygida]|uniref:Retrovirus-related Pol polyprotein from transposon TNT 1-94 n=1 Tax=Pseudolycoriella hygida TaxID=35572 RepID=A0A9Q0S346_9DIPT|nr:Retrovirus-related Pol polyprotein from transposon TNT 1-94 [Pseudolycoriella hygida]